MKRGSAEATSFGEPLVMHVAGRLKIRVSMLNLFKKRLSAKSLAVLLMNYSLTGSTMAEDGDRFALGPYGISVKDGNKVLPEDMERKQKDQLNRRDLLIIALEKIYLRGFVASTLVKNYIISKKVQDAVISTYNEFWVSWSPDDSVDYQKYFLSACQIYGAQFFIDGLEQQKQNNSGIDSDLVTQKIGKEFSAACDPFKIFADPLRSELAKEGEEIFTGSSQDISDMLEFVLEKHVVTKK